MARAGLSFLHRSLGNYTLFGASRNLRLCRLKPGTRGAGRAWTCSAAETPPRTGVSTAILWPGPDDRSSIDVDRWHVLLVKRGKAPYRGCYSLPGGSLEAGEEVLAGARREVAEETGLVVDNVQGPALQQTPAAGWLIHVCFALLAGGEPLPDVVASDDAADARFVRLCEIGHLPSTTPQLVESVYKLARLAIDSRP